MDVSSPSGNTVTVSHFRAGIARLIFFCAECMLLIGKSNNTYNQFQLLLLFFSFEENGVTV